MVEKKVEISRDDIFGLQLISLKDSYSYYFFGLAFLCGLMLLIKGIIGGFKDAMDVFLAVVFLLMPLVVLFSCYRNSVKLRKETVAFLHPLLYCMSEESFAFESYNSKGSLRWEDIFKYLEDKRSFYVYISSLQAYIIPKSFFSGEEQQEIRALLQSRVVSKAKKGRRLFSLLLIALLLFFMGMQVWLWLI